MMPLSVAPTMKPTRTGGEKTGQRHSQKLKKLLTLTQSIIDLLNGGKYASHGTCEVEEPCDKRQLTSRLVLQSSEISKRTKTRKDWSGEYSEVLPDLRQTTGNRDGCGTTLDKAESRGWQVRG